MRFPYDNDDDSDGCGTVRLETFGPNVVESSDEDPPLWTERSTDDP